MVSDSRRVASAIGVDDHHILVFKREPVGDMKSHLAGTHDNEFQRRSPLQTEPSKTGNIMKSSSSMNAQQAAFQYAGDAQKFCRYALPYHSIGVKQRNTCVRAWYPYSAELNDYRQDDMDRVLRGYRFRGSAPSWKLTSRPPMPGHHSYRRQAREGSAARCSTVPAWPRSVHRHKKKRVGTRGWKIS